MQPSTGTTLEDVRKRFHRRDPWVLRGIDLELDAGTATAVVGGNGSGKSTLLRIAAGLCRPTAGWASHPHQVGYVPERQPARLRMSGGEYLAHMGRVRGLDQATIDSRSAALFEQLNLTPGPEVAIDSLSKGNRQKVLLSQALLVRTDALVLDEPFTGLDGDSVQSLSDLLSEAQGDGTSVLISAHEAASVPPFFTTLHLTGGVLIESPSAPSVAEGTVNVVLQSNRQGCDPDPITQLRGVRSVFPDLSENRLTLVVDPALRELVLGKAIAAGWRVLYVGPTPTGSQDFD